MSPRDRPIRSSRRSFHCRSCRSGKRGEGDHETSPHGDASYERVPTTSARGRLQAIDRCTAWCVESSMIASVPDVRAVLAAAAFALACTPFEQPAPHAPVAPPPVVRVPPAPAVRVPEIYIRRGNDIVLAPAEDQA